MPWACDWRAESWRLAFGHLDRQPGSEVSIRHATGDRRPPRHWYPLVIAIALAVATAGCASIPVAGPSSEGEAAPVDGKRSPAEQKAGGASGGVEGAAKGALQGLADGMYCGYAFLPAALICAPVLALAYGLQGAMGRPVDGAVEVASPAALGNLPTSAAPTTVHKFDTLFHIAASDFAPSGVLLVERSTLLRGRAGVDGGGTFLVNLDDAADRPRTSMAIDVSVNCSTRQARLAWRRTYDGWDESGALEKSEATNAVIAPGEARDAVLHTVCRI